MRIFSNWPHGFAGRTVCGQWPKSWKAGCGISQSVALLSAAVAIAGRGITDFRHLAVKKLAEEGQLPALRHERLFQPPDTLRDKNAIEQLSSSGAAPWKCWW